MPIVALPQTTVRAIGSASIISDPCSIVKELLDNALDASASFINIEISQNTIDTIQIKDNGYGISPDDHPAVCKRAYTSKIRTVEDLKKVGGKSLGFRGEALASAAEVSGSLTVSTRVETEQVGFSLKYGRNGELISTERASHPVGTTVRITHLFKHIPVRQQTAIKNSTKSILKIRKMIQAYAMSRPCIRLSLRILKAKNDNSNWMYAPGQDANLMDAAFKVAGTEIASHCSLQEWPVSTDSEPFGVETQPGFRLTGLFLKLDPDITKINAGQYISIDGRPLTTTRGVAQNIVKLYKSYLRSACQSRCSPNISDPFLCVHIQCPESSYDVNVEPSKDDVLLEDPQLLISLVKELFQHIYGDNQDSDGESKVVNIAEQRLQRRNGFELLLARKPGPSPKPHSINTWSSSQKGGSIPVCSPVRLGPPRPGPPAQRLAIGGGSDFETLRRSRVLEFSSPESITRSKAPARQQGETRGPNETPSPVLSRTTAQYTAQGHLRLQEAIPLNIEGSCLPSPVSSATSPSAPRPSPGSPLFTRPSPPIPGRPNRSPISSTQSPLRRAQRERDRERYGKGALDTWFLRSSQATQPSITGDNHPPEENEPSLSRLTEQRFGSQAGNSVKNLESLVPEEPHSRPIDSESDSMLELDSIQTSPSTGTPVRENTNKRQELPVLERWSARLHSLSTHDQNSEGEMLLGLDTPETTATLETQTQCEILPAAPSNTESAHLNGYLATQAALNPQPESGASDTRNITISQGIPKPVLSPHDPRAYLMRLQSTKDVEKQNRSNIKRISNDKLPFERIPEGCDLHSVGLRQSSDLSVLSATFKEALKRDLYTQRGKQLEEFTSSNIGAAIELWKRRLLILIQERYRTTPDCGIPQIEFDFSNLVQRPDNTPST